MASFDPGTEIGGFRIEEVLGRGGMGTVYRAVHPRLEQRVALKVLNPDRADDEDFRDRFVREAQLASALNHPNIVPVYDAGESDGRLYLAMRLVEGYGLEEIIAQEAPLDAGRTLALLAQVASALDAAHRHGLVHRDIKPENILVTSGGATEYGEHVYLSDFGISKLVGAAGPTLTGQLVGTWGYLAPELIEGKPIDGRCDQYALGCVLYRCLTGVMPFQRETNAQLLMAHVRDPVPKIAASRQDLGREIDRVVARMMAKQPSDRYTSCGEAIAAGRASVAPTLRKRRRSPALPGRAQSRKVRTQLLGVAAGLVFVAMAGGLTAAALSDDDPPMPVRPPGASLKKSIGTAEPLRVKELEVGSPDRYVEPTTTRSTTTTPTTTTPTTTTPTTTTTTTTCPPVCPTFPD